MKNTKENDWYIDLHRISTIKKYREALEKFFNSRREALKEAMTACTKEELQKLQGQYAETNALQAKFDEIKDIIEES